MLGVVVGVAHTDGFCGIGKSGGVVEPILVLPNDQFAGFQLAEAQPDGEELLPVLQPQTLKTNSAMTKHTKKLATRMIKFLFLEGFTDFMKDKPSVPQLKDDRFGAGILIDCLNTSRQNSVAHH